MDGLKMAIAALASFGLAGPGFAGCDLGIDELEDLVGYEVEAVKSVAGWVDEDEGEVGNEDDWEGCRYNRKIIFDDGTSVTCRTYHHSSAWGAQEAVIFSKNSDQKACIDDELMDVRG